MIDMTQGRPVQVIWRFSLPLVGSVFFQQLYNMADSVIVGRYVGHEGLAAVGASYPIIMIFMAIAAGVNIGSSVVISQYYGGKHFKQVKTAALTSLISIVVLALVLTLVGSIFSNWMMVALNTPLGVFDDAAAYLRIAIYGLTFLFVYNICNGVFTAMGDSKTPFYFLVASSISNIFLDVLLVKNFGMGVRGAAWATFICQGLAGLLALFTLLYRIKHTIPEKTRIFSLPMLKKISNVSIPSILQQSFVSVGNLLVQGLVNSYGPIVMAAYSSAIKLNTFSLMTMGTAANALSNYTGQNIGAGNLERVKQGFRAGIKIALAYALPFVIMYMVFTKGVLSIFLPAKDAGQEVIREGTKFLRIVSPFYLILCFKLISDSLMRGAGEMRAFMISTFSDLILRVALSFVFSKGLGLGSMGIWMSWPIGWMVGTGVSLLLYRKGKWQEKRLIAD